MDRLKDGKSEGGTTQVKQSNSVTLSHGRLSSHCLRRADDGWEGLARAGRGHVCLHCREPRGASATAVLGKPRDDDGGDRCRCRSAANKRGKKNVSRWGGEPDADRRRACTRCVMMMLMIFFWWGAGEETPVSTCPLQCEREKPCLHHCCYRSEHTIQSEIHILFLSFKC